VHPTLFRLLLNLYPPYLGTGIRVTRISSDYREIDVEMKLRFYNRNYVGTHFGGNLYAMADPFYMLMLMQILGREYTVWDKGASIEFVAPGKGTVRARFRVDDDMIGDIIAKTADGDKYEPVYPIDITDKNDQVVARIRKTLYIRQKPPQAGR
jgi:acyl-coenzyme A thioesterase PaaI-like protein